MNVTFLAFSVPFTTRKQKTPATVLCLITTYNSDTLPTRVALEPTEENGLKEKSWVMTEKIYSARKSELGKCIGTLSERDMTEVSKQIAVVLKYAPQYENESLDFAIKSHSALHLPFSKRYRKSGNT